MSTAIRRDALPVRFPTRVWSIQSFPADGELGVAHVAVVRLEAARRSPSTPDGWAGIGREGRERFGRTNAGDGALPCASRRKSPDGESHRPEPDYGVNPTPRARLVVAVAENHCLDIDCSSKVVWDVFASGRSTARAPFQTRKPPRWPTRADRRLQQTGRGGRCGPRRIF